MDSSTDTTDSIAQLMSVAERLRMVKDAQRRFMQLWAQQRTEMVTRNLFFPMQLPPAPTRVRHRTPRRRRKFD